MSEESEIRMAYKRRGPKPKNLGFIPIGFKKSEIQDSRNRMSEGLTKLRDHVAEHGKDFSAVPDFYLYYWIFEMRNYVEEKLLPEGVMKQLREHRFPFKGDVELDKKLASQVKQPRYRHRSRYDPGV